MEQKIPSNFKRNIRSLDNCRLYKASESLVFLLYSSGILSEFLPKDLWEHHKLLIDSLYSIVEKGKTINELKEIHKKYMCYLERFQTHYGVEYVTLNVHMLTHMVWSTIFHGHLFCYSTFPFESYN